MTTSVEAQYRPPIFRDPVTWVEASITFGGGAILFFALHLGNLGQITWIMGTMLILHRWSIDRRLFQGNEKFQEALRDLHSATESVRLLSEAVNREIANNQSKLNDLESMLGSIAGYLDLSGSANTSKLRRVVDTYYHVTDPEFHQVRDMAVEDAQAALDQLAIQKRTRTLVRSEYYRWLLPMFDRVEPGCEIWAISRMLECEWDNSPEEQQFLDLNIKAAKRGVSVERIVVCTATVWKEAQRLAAIERQLNAGKNFSLRFADSDEISRRDSTLLGKIGDGLIAFDRRVVLVDEHSANGEARGFVWMNTSEIIRLRGTYEQLRVLSHNVRPNARGGPP